MQNENQGELSTVQRRSPMTVTSRVRVLRDDRVFGAMSLAVRRVMRQRRANSPLENLILNELRKAAATSTSEPVKADVVAKSLFDRIHNEDRKEGAQLPFTETILT